MSSSTKLVCLLPVRNGAQDLPGWFASVERFADAVVALDDGSTDDTQTILRSHPLVRIVVTDPPRDTYADWDDSANRNRLLDAAGALEPDWVMFLDADERISIDDAEALRSFVESDAIPGCAYRFTVYRMIGDLEHFDRNGLSVCRLFAYEPGLRMPRERLHFVPVPESIPRRRWIETTIRIQHLAGSDEQRRRQRFAKYEEADPNSEFQPGYAHLLDEPYHVEVWKPRPPGLPVVRVRDEGSTVDRIDPDAPILSAVVIARDDEERIERALRSVVSQRCSVPFEVIAVVSGSDRTAEIVSEKFPEVRLTTLPGKVLPGRARNAGLRLARGEYITFPGSHVELPPGSLEARFRAHEDGWEMVTGTTLNGTQTPAGWASYFLDHSNVLPGRRARQLGGPPGHCSYMRHHLDAVGGFPEDRRAGEDTVVNVALFRRGFRGYLADGVTVIHHTPCRTVRKLVRHHFTRGRAWGRILLDQHARRGQLMFRRRFLSRYAFSRIRRTTRNVRRWGGDLRPLYRRYFPLVVLGILAAWIGVYYELFRPARGKLSVLFGNGREELPRRPAHRGPSPMRKWYMRTGRRVRAGRESVLAPMRIVRRRIVRRAADYSWSALERIVRRRSLSLDDPDGTFINVLAIGSDSRENIIDPKDVRRFGRGVKGARADVVALAHIVPAQRQCVIVHVPRDLVTTMNGSGPRTRIATLYLEGAQSVVDAIRELLDVPIHHCVELDMTGFRRIVEAVGGVDIESAREFYDPALDFWLPRGRNRLNGNEALSYVRARYATPNGDLDRIARQQAVARAALARVLRPSVLANPWRITEFARTLGSAVVIDDRLRVEDAARIAFAFRNLGVDQIQTLVVPTRDNEDQSSLDIDELRLRTLRDRLRSGATVAH